MSFDDSSGMNKLAGVLSTRMRIENEQPLVLDFGGIQPNGSLLTNTYPQPIPKGAYSVCRHLTLGAEGDELSSAEGGEHGGHDSGDGSHTHMVKVPEKMRSLLPGDRVLVAWVENDAVVIDIIKKS